MSLQLLETTTTFAGQTAKVCAPIVARFGDRIFPGFITVVTSSAVQEAVFFDSNSDAPSFPSVGGIDFDDSATGLGDLQDGRWIFNPF